MAGDSKEYAITSSHTCDLAMINRLVEVMDAADSALNTATARPFEPKLICQHDSRNCY